MRLLIILLSQFLISACSTHAIVTSWSTSSSNIIEETGVSYHLPTARLDIVVAMGDSEIIVDLYEPRYFADPKLPSFTAGFANNWAAADDLKVEVDSKGLLKKITLTSDSQLDEVFTNITKSAVAITTGYYVPSKETATKAQPVEIGRITIDPSANESEDITAKIQDMISTYVEARISEFDIESDINANRISDLGNTKDGQKTEEISRLKKKQERLKRQKLSLQSALKASETITISFYGPYALQTVDFSKCKNKFCIRQTVPYEIVVGNQSTILNLPNNAPVLAMDLNRALVGSRTHTQDYVNGLLVTNQTTTPAELVDLTAIPFSIVNTWGKALVNSRQGRINELDSRLALKNKQLEYDKRLQEINGEREAMSSEATDDDSGETGLSSNDGDGKEAALENTSGSAPISLPTRLLSASYAFQRAIPLDSSGAVEDSPVLKETEITEAKKTKKGT